MLANELRALEIFLESASFENDFKPLSYFLIAEQLKKEKIQGTKSSVGRWAIKYKWENALKIKKQEAVIALGPQQTKEVALKVLDEHTKVTVQRNSVLISDTYDVMEKFISAVKVDIANNTYNRDDIKLAKDIAVLTTGREDKMLDRLASMGGETLSSEEMKEDFNLVEVEFEDEI
ncbi:MAG: hypothetical protein COB42_08195 [Sulfurimonas sp.]|nr:MAG: hypothetical protein COB42_08195 [Sulfurimonas sp.]